MWRVQHRGNAGRLGEFETSAWIDGRVGQLESSCWRRWGAISAINGCYHHVTMIVQTATIVFGLEGPG